ncbi:hypothetical protein M0R88_17790 [Halorussus gelatinilyticus]|uniref:Uncharacterized protein n=1 Tax=Halorussus gelatinilyticus TaxID=2937524 RepID=A0A8U0IHP0_9EURY|nr:hypothetical protein [Halorussus gelatinilyticus]UPW00348.1 hypothetical protein M0R88_17790 [Halorussus gelatinilyticus]
MDSLYDRLRDPSHTGDRRCWPCTAVNAALLVAAAAVVARRRSRALAALLGAVGAAAIALRGYLVPYTPRFAPKLVSSLPGDLFDHGDPAPDRASRTLGASDASDAPDAADTSDAPDDPDAGGESEAPDESKPSESAPDASGSLGDETDADAGEAVLSALLERGVVVTDDESVALDEAFREAWRAEMETLRARDDDGLAAALREVGPEGAVVDVVESGNWTGDDDRWFVVSDGSGDPAAESWLTWPVAVAETAAVRALAAETDLDASRRAQAAGPLRTLLRACPVCDGPVEETTEVDCCGGPGGTQPDAPDDVLACANCDARLYTFE